MICARIGWMNDQAASLGIRIFHFMYQNPALTFGGILFPGDLAKAIADGTRCVVFADGTRCVVFCDQWLETQKRPAKTLKAAPTKFYA